MLKGVNLTLMIGPAVPVPVPQSVLDALTSVEINTTAQPGVPSGFTLTFTLSNKSPLHTLFLLTGGGIVPLMRVIIIATVSGTPQVLMDGVITRQSISPASGGHSTLTITGTDLTAMMNLIDFDGFPFPAMPVNLRVMAILAKYAMFGLIPLVIPPLLMDVPLPVERIPRQQGKDLEYINKLAHDVGYVFYLDPGPVPGTNVAYWGPEIKVGVPQPALNIDMDAHTNVESLTFNFDADMKTLPVVFIYIKEAKITLPIPIPDINPLQPPLGVIPPLPLKLDFLNDTADKTPMEAAMEGIAEAGRSGDVVTGNGTLNVLRYGRVLKARQLVGVRGAGTAFDGLYFVQKVTHSIKRGEYKQSFTLTRNALVSITPRVVP